MTAYTATFSDGSTKSLKNSRREYAVAWLARVQENGPSGRLHTFSGFARDAAAASKAIASETACIRNKGRWTPNGGVMTHSEVVAVVAG